MSWARQSETYVINSRDRLSGTDTNFQYRIETPSNAQFDRVAIVAASIPKSYYTIYISDSNYPENTFTLTELGIDYSVAIPPGNYTRRAFSIVVQDLLNNAGPNGWAYLITYANANITGDNGKWTITVSGNGGNQPTISFNQYSSVWQHFGFNELSANTFVANTIQSDNVPVLQSEQTLYLRSDICQNFQNNIIAAIYVDSTDFSSVTYNCPDIYGNSRKLRDHSSNTYNFQITDENGRQIDTNGVNVNFTIMLFQEAKLFDAIATLVGIKKFELDLQD